MPALSPAVHIGGQMLESFQQNNRQAGVLLQGDICEQSLICALVKPIYEFCVCLWVKVLQMIKIAALETESSFVSSKADGE